MGEMKDSNKREIIKKENNKKIRSTQNDSKSVFTRLFIQSIKK